MENVESKMEDMAKMEKPVKKIKAFRFAPELIESVHNIMKETGKKETAVVTAAIEQYVAQYRSLHPQ